MRRLLSGAIGLAVAGSLAGWILTAPDLVSETLLDGIQPDFARGQEVFFAGGCASCHSAPDAKEEAKLVLAGGKRFASDFGTFIAPNISSDPVTGIGAWTARDLANALMHGTGRDGSHYYPAFPYTSYSKMTPDDVVSLHAFLETLPPNATPSQPHEVGFPFNIRRSLGAWKLLFLKADWIVSGDLSEDQSRGRYLVEALGHCGECHTARNALGGLNRQAWLAGAPDPSGKSRIPNITPGELDWSEADIAEYLKSGFTPEYDSAGGEMADVIENTSKLSDADRLAIAAYLKIVPPLANGQ
jgi:mono/diheme cytochrome c family protein